MWTVESALEQIRLANPFSDETENAADWLHDRILLGTRADAVTVAEMTLDALIEEMKEK